mgnify:CR=1 FL=1
MYRVKFVVAAALAAWSVSILAQAPAGVTAFEGARVHRRRRTRSHRERHVRRDRQPRSRAVGRAARRSRPRWAQRA